VEFVVASEKEFSEIMYRVASVASGRS